MTTETVNRFGEDRNKPEGERPKDLGALASEWILARGVPSAPSLLRYLERFAKSVVEWDRERAKATTGPAGSVDAATREGAESSAATVSAGSTQPAETGHPSEPSDEELAKRLFENTSGLFWVNQSVAWRSWVLSCVKHARDFGRASRSAEVEELKAKLEALTEPARGKVPGLHARRLAPNAGNPREAAFAEAWERESVLPLLLGDGTRRVEPTRRDAEIAATIIQWLGSNVGQSFLRELGYVPTSERPGGDGG